MDGSLFGTSGIRGDAESYFTDQLCFDLGRTFAIFLKNKYDQGGVAIGSDPRQSSPRIKSCVSSGLIFEGLKVIDQAIAPIPSINYVLIANNDDFAGSIMVSGSHIKAHLNGLKFFAGTEEILKMDEAQIDEIYNRIKMLVKYTNLSGQIVYKPTAVGYYIDYLKSKAKVPYKKWKVVVDAGNGAQSGVISKLLLDLGLDVVAVNDSNSKGFLARDTEVESDFESLKEEVKKNSADFGVGYDSDGDRVVFVDEKGSYITGDYTGTLVARTMTGMKIVTPINTSSVIESIGKEVIRTKVGSPYVVTAMKENSSEFGFEANGGGIFNDMHSRDGGRMTIEVLNLLLKENKKLSEVVSELPKYFISRDKIEYKWELKSKIIEEAKKEFKGIKVSEMDGLKIWSDENTWILFRSSSNAPEFRVFVESSSEEKSKQLLQQGLDLVRRVITQ